MKLGYIGIDQFGQHYKIDKYPRKELLEQLYATHADKMYTDTKSGKTKHIGYVISKLWIRVYQVNEWKEA